MRSQDSADYKIGNETYSSPPTATQNPPTHITDAWQLPFSSSLFCWGRGRVGRSLNAERLLDKASCKAKCEILTTGSNGLCFYARSQIWCLESLRCSCTLESHSAC